MCPDHESTETFNYKAIKEEHGIEVLQKVRKWENLSKSAGRYRSHQKFYLQCKHLDLTPTGIKLKTTVEGNDARNILRKAEKALLNVRISEIIKKRALLAKKKLLVIMSCVIIL